MDIPGQIEEGNSSNVIYFAPELEPKVRVTCSHCVPHCLHAVYGNTCLMPTAKCCCC